MKTLFFRTLFLTFLLPLLVSGTAWGAMGEITEFSFRSAQEDLLGMEESSEPDGKPDVHLSVSIKGIGAITDVSLKAVDGVREWDTVAGNEKWGIVVKDATGKTISTGSGMPIVPFLGFATLNLYVSDDGTAFSLTREYEVSVKFIDGSTATAKAEVKGMPEIFTPETQAQETGTDAMKAFLYGIRPADAAGKRETIGGDGVDDAHFRVSFSTISVVDQITIRNIDGTNAMWDTVPGNGVWGIAVFMKDEIKNRPDGSVRFAVEGDTVLDLLVADNGAVAGGKTRFEVIIRFIDGTILRETASTEASSAQPSSEEGFLSAFLFPPSSGDFVGRSESPGGDGKPDWKVSARISARGTIISLIIRGLDGAPGEWDTLPGNGKPLAAVTDNTGKILNSPQGSVSIPVEGTMEMNLWLADDGSLTTTTNRYRIIAVFSDGRTLERSIDRGTVEPSRQAQQPEGETIQISNSVKAFYMGKGPRNILGKGEPADIRSGLDANPDAHIRLRLLSIEGIIRSITIESLDGKGGDWDTIPGNGIWHIAVTENPTGPVISKTDGSITKSVSGNTDLHLWLADNGKLSANPSNYRVIVRFTDGRALAQNLF